MSIYYIQTNSGEIYELDATTEISYKLSGRSTDNVVESGETVTDDFINKPDVITLRGTISDTKSLSSGGVVSKTTEVFIRDLTQVKTNKERFSFHFGDKVGVITNCIFERLDFTQTTQRGHANGIDAFGVVMTIKQVRSATRALLAPFRDPTITDDATNQGTGAGSTQSPTEEEETRLNQSLRMIRGG